ncbi:hypothetical protein [Pseudomonas moraviensis]|uniref:hypothetical protein n=1 Tax=Pseudomonas moraviensis TaxID=321662 RepID=UPI000F7AA96F|nr:hypothetical protein [Pseudomonas moraviensis]
MPMLLKRRKQPDASTDRQTFHVANRASARWIYRFSKGVWRDAINFGKTCTTLYFCIIVELFEWRDDALPSLFMADRYRREKTMKMSMQNPAPLQQRRAACHRGTRVYGLISTLSNA